MSEPDDRAASTRIAKATPASQAPKVRITRQRNMSLNEEEAYLKEINIANLRIAASSDSRAIRMYFRWKTKFIIAVKVIIERRGTIFINIV